MPSSNLADMRIPSEEFERYLRERGVPERKPFVHGLTVTPVVDDVFIPLVIPKVEASQTHQVLSEENEKWRRYAAALEELVRPGVAAAIRKAVWG